MKKNKLQKEFLDQLRKIPIVLVACEKSGLSRNSVYRWRKGDEAFATEMDVALKEGEDLVNDMSESQLLTMIKEKNWSAVSFWLRHRNPKFRERIEVTTKTVSDALSPEQESIVREALKLASTKHHGKSTEDNPAGIGGTDDSGQKD